jgi:hypothetical protein
MKEFLKTHHLNLLVVSGFILGVAVTLAALQFDFARRWLVPSSGNGVFSGKPAVAAAATPAPAPVAASAPRPQSLATPPPVNPAIAATQSTVEAYMKKYTAPGSVISFVDWTDFSTAGDATAITLHYRVTKQTGDSIDANVRFLVQAGVVTRTAVISTGPAAGSRPQPSAAGAAPVVIDHFSAPIQAAMNGPEMTIEPNNAYSLSQLDQAKQEAQLEHKPLGFIMVWAPFFDQAAGPRDNGSVSALVHFYEVFHQNVVLVFVRHESELPFVPPAVKQGYGGPDEGGYAPNMAVTDATATEFIVEIPFKNLDGPGRDQLFAAGGKKIDQWLSTHPSAMAIPASEGP